MTKNSLVNEWEDLTNVKDSKQFEDLKLMNSWNDFKDETTMAQTNNLAIS